MSNSTHAHTDMRRKTKFLNLKHGSMPVLEYEHKFNDISRFAPKLIPNEEGSMSIDDLRKEIRASSARRTDMSSFGGPSQGPSKRYGSSSNSAGSGWSGGRGSNSGSGRSGPMPTWSQNSDQQSVVKVKVVPLHQLFKSECPLLSQGGIARQGTVAQQGQGNRGQSQSQSGASSSPVGSSSNIRVQSTFRGRDGRHWRG
ncbi:unnamed protein product [Prunus armeniaca]